MYAQTRLTALAQARVWLELEQVSDPNNESIARKLDYLDDEINSCRAIAPAEMANFSMLLAEETMRSTNRLMDNDD